MACGNQRLLFPQLCLVYLFLVRSYFLLLGKLNQKMLPFKILKNLPPKKNLSCRRQIRLRRKIVSGAAPRLRRGVGGQAAPFRPPASGFAGGIPRPGPAAGGNGAGPAA